jgi:nanoRNase/pAp phosphatase (c-di-AMP/oligoRNAs hydrolase)
MANEMTSEPVESPTTSDRKERAERFAATLRANEGKRICVAIRGYPDPDSIASAWAHRRIAEKVGSVCDVVHFDPVSRPENRAMVNLLELKIKRIADPSELTAYAAYCLVDANEARLPPGSPPIPCLTVVDHHRPTEHPQGARFVDIREDVGATSTIYAEYLRLGPIGFPQDRKKARALATALAYGIRSDTDDLVRATPDDLDALASVQPLVDPELLASLAHASMTPRTMEIIETALASGVVEGTFVFAGVGHVRDDDRDAIGQTADFLLRREGIATAIVYGIVGGDTIDGSLRTHSPSLDPDLWLKETFGRDPQTGRPYGGGRRDAGGFQIPMGILAQCSDRDLLWKVASVTIEELIRARLGVATLPLKEVPLDPGVSKRTAA